MKNLILGLAGTLLLCSAAYATDYVYTVQNMQTSPAKSALFIFYPPGADPFSKNLISGQKWIYGQKNAPFTHINVYIPKDSHGDFEGTCYQIAGNPVTNPDGHIYIDVTARIDSDGVRAKCEQVYRGF